MPPHPIAPYRTRTVSTDRARLLRLIQSPVTYRDGKLPTRIPFLFGTKRGDVTASPSSLTPASLPRERASPSSLTPAPSSLTPLPLDLAFLFDTSPFLFDLVPGHGATMAVLAPPESTSLYRRIPFLMGSVRPDAYKSDLHVLHAGMGMGQDHTTQGEEAVRQVSTLGPGAPNPKPQTPNPNPKVDEPNR